MSDGPAPGTRTEAPSPGSAEGGRTRRARRREFYSIGEVCEMLDLKPHVLRYWETQFDGLSPTKNRSGNRVYRVADVEMIALIQRLVHAERYTIEGARRKLEEMREAGTAEQVAVRAGERSYLRWLRGELERVLEILDPVSG